MTLMVRPPYYSAAPLLALLVALPPLTRAHLSARLAPRPFPPPHRAPPPPFPGASKGSIQSCTPTELEAAGCDGQAYFDPDGLHKPALEVDLSLLLPLVVQQLLLGKGRGIAFVNEQISSMRRAPSEDAAKALIYAVVCENFPELCTPVARREASSQATAGFAAPGPAGSAEDAHARGSSRHATKLVDWFYAMVMKRGPWTNSTNDIYDAMRCIDHLPIR